MAAAKKPLLHEILAIEQETKTSAERARSETINTFRTKQNHFTGIRRTFRRVRLKVWRMWHKLLN